MKAPVLALAVLLLVPVTLAAPSDEVLTDFGEAIEAYNQNADQLPEPIALLIKDERINLHLTVEDEEHVYGFVMDGVMVSDWQNSSLQDPTLMIYTSAATIDAIVTAEDPKKRAVEALNSDEIRHEQPGLLDKIKFGVLSILLKLFGGFL